MQEETTLYTIIESPVGALLIAGAERGLTVIRFLERDGVVEPYAAMEDPTWRRDDSAHADAIEQLRAYFAGELRAFDLQLAPSGTTFQRLAWSALERIPYGTTISYGEQARMIGKPDAVRAVGAANGRNPLPIVIPCHRVIGSDRSLTGFGGGMRIKEMLLALEGAWHPQGEQLSLL